MEKFTNALTKVCTVVIVAILLVLSVLIVGALACGCVGIIRWGLGI